MMKVGIVASPQARAARSTPSRRQNVAARESVCRRWQTSSRPVTDAFASSSRKFSAGSRSRFERRRRRRGRGRGGVVITVVSVAEARSVSNAAAVCTTTLRHWRQGHVQVEFVVGGGSQTVVGQSAAECHYWRQCCGRASTSLIQSAPLNLTTMNYVELWKGRTGCCRCWLWLYMRG